MSITNGKNIDKMTHNGHEVKTWIHNGVEVFKSLVEYIYRAGAWLVPYTLSEKWSEQEGSLRISGNYKGKGSETVGTASFTLDVTNANKISVTYSLSMGGSTNAAPGGSMKLYSAADTTINVSSSGEKTEYCIELDISALTGEQTFNLQHTISQSYEQSPYQYTAWTVVQVFNIDVE